MTTTDNRHPVPPAWAMPVNPANTTMGLTLGMCVVTETSKNEDPSGHVQVHRELFLWDDALEDVDDIEQGWQLGADQRWEDAHGPVEALRERLAAWHLNRGMVPPT